MIGKRLKFLREEKNLTQPELAKELQMSASSIGMYETDAREPSDEIKIKIANYFEVSIDYLAGLSDDKTPEDTLQIGLSREEEGILTEEDKQQIRDFAKFVVNRRKEEK